MGAAEDYEGGEDREDDTDGDRRHGSGGSVRCGDVICQGGRGVEGLQSVESEGEAQDQQDGEDDAEPTLAQSLFDVVGRTAQEAAVLLLHLPDLRQSGFDECRGGADNGHCPHPEDRAGAAGGDSGCNAGDIARADTGCGGNHHRLEGADGLLAIVVLLLGQAGEHILDEADLHAAGAEREVHACHDEHDHEDIGVHEAVDHTSDLNELVVHSFPSRIDEKTRKYLSQKPQNVNFMLRISVNFRRRGCLGPRCFRNFRVEGRYRRG